MAVVSKDRRIGRRYGSKVTIRTWLSENQDEYDDREKLVKACTRKLRVSREAVLKTLRETTATNGRTAAPKPGPNARRGKSGVSRDNFQAMFDADTAVRQAIRSGVATLGNDELLNDSQFRRERCNGATQLRWRQIADEPEFASHQFRCGGKVWWATRATVKWALKHVNKAKEL
jgi:hypothetical protein